MRERLRRTQILLDPAQHRALSEIARREGRSLSETIRTMLGEGLERRREAIDKALKRQLEALDQIQRHRDEMMERQGGKPIDLDSVDVLHQIREEQDERNFPGIPVSRD